MGVIGKLDFIIRHFQGCTESTEPIKSPLWPSRTACNVKLQPTSEHKTNDSSIRALYGFCCIELVNERSRVKAHPVLRKAAVKYE